MGVRSGALTAVVLFAAATHFYPGSSAESAPQTAPGASIAGHKEQPPAKQKDKKGKLILEAAAKPHSPGFSSPYLPDFKPSDMARIESGLEPEHQAEALVNRFFHRLATDGTKPLPEHVKFVVALAPDPRHTNLALMFDRQMSSVQQAAQDAGYTFDSSWLPWQTDTQRTGSLSDRQLEEAEQDEREENPGILLFRRSITNLASKSLTDDGLVVLVVGERPTSGINQAQWSNALKWITQHVRKTASGPSRSLAVLGPTFTGSLASLQRNLADIYPEEATVPVHRQRNGAALNNRHVTLPFQARFPTARVMSGGISSCASVQWFEKTKPTQVRFETFQENDDLQLTRFFAYLSAQQTRASDVSILSEDETAYAEIADSNDAQCRMVTTEPGPLRLAFPRDISALRGAYQRQSVFAAPTTTREQHPILQEGGEQDPDANESDTIQTKSGHLAAFGQEAVLFGIVSQLRTHHIHVIVLRCTNPLDFLFLTRFLHLHYAEARIVTVGSDLLFRREIDTTEFRGVLSLSSYPLLPRVQHWTALENASILSGTTQLHIPHVHRIFDSHVAEGTYLASRFLMAGEPVHPDDPLERLNNLPDSAEPFWLSRTPSVEDPKVYAPTWLSVVGRDGYWPVAVLDERMRFTVTAPKPPISSIAKFTPTVGAHYPNASATDPDHFKSSLHLPLAWELWTGAALLLLVYQMLAIFLGSEQAAAGIFSPFRKSGIRAQQILIGASTALALTGVCLPLAVGFTFSVEDFLGKGFLFWATIVIAVIGAAFFLWIATKGGPSVPQYTKGIAGGVLFLAFCISWLVLRLSNVTEYNWLFFVSLGITVIAFVAVVWQTIASARRWLLWSFVISLALACGVLYLTIHLSLLGTIECSAMAEGTANRVPLFYRMAHLTSGASPLLPFLFLTPGFYLWSWQAMAGSAMLLEGKPTLPRETKDPASTGWKWLLECSVPGILIAEEQVPSTTVPARLRKISSFVGDRMLHVASPLTVTTGILIVPVFAILIAVAFFGQDLPLLSLEGRPFDICLNLGLMVSFVLTLTEASRLFWVWRDMRRLLSALNQTRLPRTFARLRPIGFDTLFSMSGQVQRLQYLFFTQQLDAAKRLRAIIAEPSLLLDVVEFGEAFETRAQQRRNTGAGWEIPVTYQIASASEKEASTKSKSRLMRHVLNDATASVLTELLKCWAKDRTSLALEPANSKCTQGDERIQFEYAPVEEPGILAAEEFVCFHYIAFIQNILGRMRTIILSMVCLFVSACLTVSFYPFVPRTQIATWLIFNLGVIGAVVIYVYAALERNEVLSLITNTRPGKLGSEFWVKLVGFFTGPILGILATQFPSISDTVLGWLQPALDTIK